MSSVLAVDVGNTTTAFGIYRGADLEARWSITTQPRTADEYVLSIDGMLNRLGTRPSGAVIGSVVPPEVGAVRRAVARLVQGKIVHVGPGTRTGLPIDLQ